MIDSVVKRKINGTERDYYVLKLPAGDMLVMIPVDTSAEIGVRPIVDADEAEKILGSIPGLEIEMTQNWNKRYRENMLKIKSGNLLEVAAVVKGLMQRDKERGLSTCLLYTSAARPPLRLRTARARRFTAWLTSAFLPRARWSPSWIPW